MAADPLQLFALQRSADLGDRIAIALGLSRSPHEEREFEEGEHKSRPLVSVRGADVYVVHSLHGEPGASANDKLVRLLFFLGALHDADAARVTAIVPYLCYARKDRRTKPRDPVSTRYVARVFEAMEVDRVVTFDVHNDAAFENAFRCRVENLEARPLLVAHVLERLSGRAPLVVSPDIGGTKRAQRFADTLAARLGRPVPVGFLEKRRSEGVVSGGETVIGDVADRDVVIVDDLIASGGTLARAAVACRAQGAATVIAVATHPKFDADAAGNLSRAPLDALFVTDTIPTTNAPERTTVVPIAGRVAEVISRLHTGGSLAELHE